MDSLNMMAGVALIHVVAALACGFWAYGDADKRSRSGILWLLIVCFLLGLSSGYSVALSSR